MSFKEAGAYSKRDVHVLFLLFEMSKRFSRRHKHTLNVSASGFDS